MRKLFFAIAVAVLFAQPSQAAVNCGKAEVVKGDVKIKSGGEAKPLAVGDKVCQGDQVITAKDSRAKLVMDDGNVLNVNPASGVKIEAYANDGGEKKKVLLNVMYGKMRATVNQKYNGDGQSFQVKTKSAVAGVRGTDFLTGYEPKSNKMQVVTFEGRVEVGKAGPGGSILNPVSVTAGQQTEAIRGQPPAPPKSVPASELKEMNGNSQADNKNGRGMGEGAPRNENGYANKEGSEGDRAPSSAPTMLPPPTADLSGGETLVLTGGTELPPPPPPLPPEIPKCDYCNQVINSGPAKVNLSITIGQ